MKFMVMLEHFLVVQVHSQNTLLHLLTRFQKSQNQLIWLQQLLCPLQVQALSKPLKSISSFGKGRIILIHGGSGGIGSLAIQLAKFHEAYVATTVSTSNIEDYDAVLVAAAEELGNSYKVLKKGGTLVSIVGNADENLAKEHGITAITQMTQTSTSQLKRLGELVDSGKIKPLIDKTSTLNNAKEAFDYFEQKHPRGKVVIKIK